MFLFRGEKTTSSVRLRKRRDDPQLQHHQQPGDQQQARRKNHRHSGDFAFFSPNRHASPPADRDSGASLGEDFNYITFPNGVPIVHEVRVGGANKGGVAPQQQQQQHQHNNPIRVTMRDINIKESFSIFIHRVDDDNDGDTGIIEIVTFIIMSVSHLVLTSDDVSWSDPLWTTTYVAGSFFTTVLRIRHILPQPNTTFYTFFTKVFVFIGVMIFATFESAIEGLGKQTIGTVPVPTYLVWQPIMFVT